MSAEKSLVLPCTLGSSRDSRHCLALSERPLRQLRYNQAIADVEFGAIEQRSVTPLPRPGVQVGGKTFEPRFDVGNSSE